MLSGAEYGSCTSKALWGRIGTTCAVRERAAQVRVSQGSFSVNGRGKVDIGNRVIGRGWPHAHPRNVNWAGNANSREQGGSVDLLKLCRETGDSRQRPGTIAGCTGGGHYK